MKSANNIYPFPDRQILRDMGLAVYVTPYQAQKKWNNLWSKYKLAKRGQVNISLSVCYLIKVILFQLTIKIPS